MTAEQAIYELFSDLGLTVVRKGSVYDGGIRARLPYIILPDFSPNSAGERGERSLEIWCRDGEDWEFYRDIETIISLLIPLEGNVLTFDKGSVHLRRSKPFISYLPQTKDNSLKGMRVNIGYEYSEYESKLVISDDSGREFIVDADNDVIINKSLCGGRAVSVSGKTSFDYIGVRTDIRIITDWIPAYSLNKLCAMVSASPLLTCSYRYDDDGMMRDVTGKFIVDMPIIKQVSRNSKDGECFKAEINAVSKEAV